MRSLASAGFLFLVTAITAVAQLQFAPSAASTQLYFAQLADGGPAEQKWAVTLILDNPSTAVSSAVSVSFFDDKGHALPLDFGEGPAASLNLTLPPGGSRTFTSLGASSTTSMGWAVANATNPITGTVLYRATNSGKPIWDVAAAGTGPTYLYSAYANYNLGIALVNPSATQTINIVIAPHDANGAAEPTIPVSLAPNSHTAFNLGGSISGFPLDFSGSVAITTADNPPIPFVAWALNSRDQLLSPLPPGELRFPSSYQRRAADVFAQMISAQTALVSLLGTTAGVGDAVVYGQRISALKLTVDPGTTIAASASGDGKIHVSAALLEALGDSRSALGFLIAHFVVISVIGSQANPVNTQPTADTLGIFSVLEAGYDPAGPADLFARLQLAMAEGVPIDPSLSSEFSAASDQRLQQIGSYAQNNCASVAALASVCQAVHNLWHAQYPSQVP